MASEKSDLRYLDEERKKLWVELRGSQNTISEIISLISQLKNEITEHTKLLPEEVKSAKANSSLITRYKNSTNLSKDEASKSNEIIKTIQSNITNIYDEAEQKSREIAGSHLKSIELVAKIEEISEKSSELEKHFENFDSITQQVESLESTSESIEEIKEKCNQSLSYIQKLHKETRELHGSIFGYVYKDEETGQLNKVTGLKHELESTYNKLEDGLANASINIEHILEESRQKTNDCIKTNTSTIEEQVKAWKTEHDEVMKKIRDLLPQALTAGLSVAFSDKKQAEQTEQTNLTNKFSNTIKWLSVISMLPVVTSFYFIYTLGVEIAVSKLPELVTAVIPIYVPILWLAYSYNKRLNLSKRLVEEYTHKEVLSKTFEGLSHQIDSIDNNEISKELRIKLLYNLLSVSSENPGKLISDYNKSDHPILDVLERSSKLSDAVESLSRIPGMGAISKFMDKKSDELIANQEKKVQDGLSLVSAADNQAKPKEQVREEA